MNSKLFMIASPVTREWAGGDFPAQPLRSLDEVVGAFDRTSGGRAPVVWIADEAAQVCPLAQHRPRAGANHRLLLLNGASWMEREVLSLVFRFVVSPGQGMRLLPADELRDVLAAPEREDLIIGGFASRTRRSRASSAARSPARTGARWKPSPAAWACRPRSWARTEPSGAELRPNPAGHSV